MITTRVFQSDEYQALRIPEEYRFSEDEVLINKVGDSLIMTPKSKLPKTMNDGFRAFTDDFAGHVPARKSLSRNVSLD